MSLTKPGTVKETGAHANDLLIGTEKTNDGFIIKIQEDQPMNSGSRVIGAFQIMEPGVGSYSADFALYVGQTFNCAKDLVDILAAKRGFKNIHVLNCNSLRVYDPRTSGYVKRTDWHTKPLPVEHVSVPIQETFSLSEMALIQQGFKPQEMEDKWFIFLEGDKLFLHRSWTGYCIYVVQFRPLVDHYIATSIDINRDKNQYLQVDALFDTRLALYLIRAFLLQQQVPFPDYSDATEEVNPLKLWSMIGGTLFNS